jgi:hypothetical protein
LCHQTLINSTGNTCKIHQGYVGNLTERPLLHQVFNNYLNKAARLVLSKPFGCHSFTFNLVALIDPYFNDEKHYLLDDIAFCVINLANDKWG